MTILFSVLTTVYVTATVAGLAYQNVKPILEYVPSVTAAFVKVAGKMKENLEQVMLPEDRRQSEQAKIFLEKYQPLANWVLRKVAIRLIVAWGILGLSLGVIVLGLGLLMYFNAINSPIIVGARIIGTWMILLIPALVALGSAVGIIKGNWISRLQLSITTTLRQSVPDGGSWSGLLSFGMMIHEDIAEAYDLSVSLSSISKEERDFIHRYVEVIEWLKIVEAISANLSWLQLDVGKDAATMEKKGVSYLTTESYNESLYCFLCALDALPKENTADAESTSENENDKLEAKIRYHIGRLLSQKKDVRAIQYFEKAIDLDSATYKESIFSPNNKTFIDPIRDMAAFKEFSQKHNKVNTDQDAKTPVIETVAQTRVDKEAAKSEPPKKGLWEWVKRKLSRR